MSNHRRRVQPQPRRRGKPRGPWPVRALLIFAAGAAYFVWQFLPILAISRPSEAIVDRASEAEDYGRLKIIANIISQRGAAVAPDGRVDVYKVVLAEFGTMPRFVVELCSSVRSESGATEREIEKGDYSNFPFERAKGAVVPNAAERPVAWDPAPQELGWRLVGLSNGEVKRVEESEFARFLTSYGID